MILRPRTAADIAACVDIMRRTHETSDYPRFWPDDPISFLASDAETDSWVAVTDSGSIVGHVALHRADDAALAAFVTAQTGASTHAQAYVARLLVDPGTQASGIGRALLHLATQKAEQNNTIPVLDVLQTATGAIAFYERLGWRKIGSFNLELPNNPDLPLWVYASPNSEPRVPS